MAHILFQSIPNDFEDTTKQYNKKENITVEIHPGTPWLTAGKTFKDLTLQNRNQNSDL